MIDRTPGGGWRIIGASSRGAAHVRTGRPNQDAWHYWSPKDATGLPAVVAVSDGHGSATHFRSHVGAGLAVHAATQILRGFVAERPGSGDVAAGEPAVAQALPRRLVELWKQNVAAHLRANPFTAEEWEHAVEEQGSQTRQIVENNPLLAYGATLLAVLATESFIAYLQLGDGDILCVSDEGEATRPLPPDPRLMANETTSLCEPDAWNDFRVRTVSNTERTPALVLLSTDGYANSFRTEEDFLIIGRDYLQLLRAKGMEQLQSELEAILSDASANGSGDDVTLGLLTRIGEGEQTMPDSQGRIADLEGRVKQLGERYEGIRRRMTFLQAGVFLALVLALLGCAVAFVWSYRLYAPRPESGQVEQARPEPERVTR